MGKIVESNVCRHQPRGGLVIDQGDPWVCVCARVWLPVWNRTNWWVSFIPRLQAYYTLYFGSSCSGGRASCRTLKFVAWTNRSISIGVTSEIYKKNHDVSSHSPSKPGIGVCAPHFFKHLNHIKLVLYPMICHEASHEIYHKLLYNPWNSPSSPMKDTPQPGTCFSRPICAHRGVDLWPPTLLTTSRSRGFQDLESGVCLMSKMWRYDSRCFKFCGFLTIYLCVCVFPHVKSLLRNVGRFGHLSKCF